MNQFLHVGSLDGEAMIEMNNVAVGYLSSQTPQMCVYPPLMPIQIVSVEISAPAPAQQEHGTEVKS